MSPTPFVTPADYGTIKNGSYIAIPDGAQPGTPTQTSPTIGSVYGSVSPSDKSLESSLTGYKTTADAPVDEQAIRDATMQRLKTEIDATNGVYNEKMRQAQITGENNLGTNAAISARRGLLGSDFGGALDQKVRENNNQVYSGIDAERAARIAEITNSGLAMARQEIQDKLAAKQQGAQDYISFLGKAEERRTARTQDAAKRAIAAGVDLSKMSPSEVKAVADSYQINPEALVSSYVDARNAQAKSNLDISKGTADLTKPVGLPTSDNGFQYDPTTGQYKQTITGTPADPSIKEFQYAVNNDGYTGSYTDFLRTKANLRTTVGIQTNPLTGVQTKYERSGPNVAGTNTASVTDRPAPIMANTPAPTASPEPGSSPTAAYTGDLPNPANKVQLKYLQNFQQAIGPKGVITAQNTAIGHLGLALDIASQLQNFNLQPANRGKNFFATAEGQAAVNNYTQVHTLSADELSSAYGADTGAERGLNAAIGGANSSPAQIMGYAQTASQALTSKILANISGYKTAMGQETPINLNWFISPENQTSLKSLGIIFKQQGNDIGAYQVQKDGTAKLIK